MSMNTHRSVRAVVFFCRRHLPWIAVAVVAGVFRLWKIERFPFFLGDEDIYLHLSQGFLTGRHTMFAIPYAYMPHPPFFFFLGGIFTALFGTTYITLRTLCALCAVASCLGLITLGKKIQGSALGLTAGLLLAVMPQAVYFSRIAFGYIILSALVVLLAVLMEQYEREIQNRVVLGMSAAIVAGLSSVTELSGGAILLCFLLFIARYHRRELFRLSIPAIGIPLLNYGYFFFRTPNWFIADLQVNSGRGGSSLYALLIIVLLFAGILWAVPVIRRVLITLVKQSRVIIPVVLPVVALLFYSPLITYDQINTSSTLYWLGSAGLLLYLPGSAKRSFVVWETFSFLLFQLFIDRSDRTLSPLYPFLAFGLALIVIRSYQVWKNISAHLPGWKSLWRVVTVVWVFGIIGYQAVQSGFILRLAVSDEASRWEAEMVQVTSYLATHSLVTDLVVGAPDMTHLANERKATWSQFVSYGETPKYRYSIGEAYPLGRYLYPVSSRDARFIVIVEELLKGLKGEEDMLVYFRHGTVAKMYEIELQRKKVADVLTWPSVTIGDFIIFENPDL